MESIETLNQLTQLSHGRGERGVARGDVFGRFRFWDSFIIFFTEELELIVGSGEVLSIHNSQCSMHNWAGPVRPSTGP